MKKIAATALVAAFIASGLGMAISPAGEAEAGKKFAKVTMQMHLAGQGHGSNRAF